MTHSYPSDINREQFDKIKPMLESARKKTRPNTSLHMVIIAFAVLLVKKL